MTTSYDTTDNTDENKHLENMEIITGSWFLNGVKPDKSGCNLYLFDYNTAQDNSGWKLIKLVMVIGSSQWMLMKTRAATLGDKHYIL